jgi:uncharacterized protein YjiS (DUF1127 family)
MPNSDATTRHQDQRSRASRAAFGSWAAMLRAACARSLNCGRERRVLAELSDHLLRDIGCARTDARGTVRRVRL